MRELGNYNLSLNQYEDQYTLGVLQTSNKRYVVCNIELQKDIKTKKECV